MSKSEIILTILAVIVCCVFMIRYSIPLLIEWLEALSIDETTIMMEDDDEYTEMPILRAHDDGDGFLF